MKRLTFFKIATFVLLAFNIGLVAFFILTKPPHPRGQNHGPIHHVLQLNEDQEYVFQDLVKEHQEKMAEINKLQAAAASEYFYKQLSKTNEEDDSIEMKKVKEIEVQKLQATYEHLMDVKGILTPEQLPHFKTFTGQLLDRIMGNHKNMPPPRPLHKK